MVSAGVALVGEGGSKVQDAEQEWREVRQVRRAGSSEGAKGGGIYGRARGWVDEADGQGRRIEEQTNGRAERERGVRVCPRGRGMW